MGVKEWWERQPQWLKWVISAIITVVLSIIGSMMPSLLGMFYGAVGVQGVAIILAITVPLFIALLLSQKYVLDILGKKLDTITDILTKIAEKLGVDVGERVYSPGFVYTSCRWLRISREEMGKDTRHIYIYCGHPNNPMTPHGCPRGCPYLDTSDKPTGAGAFAGLVLGGLAGLVVGGAAGVIIGGLLGAIIGNSLEETKPAQARIKELREKGTPFQIHVDERRLRASQP